MNNDIRKQYEVVTLTNILKRDWQFRFDNLVYDFPKEGVMFPRPLGEFAAYKMAMQAIFENESYEIETARGQIQKIQGGTPMADENLIKKYTNMVLPSIDPELESAGRPLTEGELYRQSIEKIKNGEYTNTTEEDGFADLDNEPEAEEITLRRQDIEDSMTWKDIQTLAKEYEVMQAGMSKHDAIEAILAKEFSEE